MNNSKLSNTGMLKIASRWLQLLRAGKLSKPDFKRIIYHTSNNLNNQNQNISPYLRSLVAKPKFFQEQYSKATSGNIPGGTTAIRGSLSAQAPVLSSKDLLNKSRDMYKSMEGHMKPEASSINEYFIKPYDTLSNAEKAFLPILKAYKKKGDTHKIWGFRPTTEKYLAETGQANFPTAYLPNLFGVVSIRPPGYSGWGSAKPFANYTRHEIAHAFHAIAPKTFEKDVVGRSAMLMRRFPHLRSHMEEHPLEHAAQYIASRGKSRGAQTYIRDTINSANAPRPELPTLDSKTLAGVDSLAKQSLKLDPTGRDATALIHSTKNYLAPLPIRYTNPGYFNPNPYLP